MRKLVLVVWGLVAMALLALAAVFFLEPRFNESVADTLGRGDYDLTTTNGRAFTEHSLRGEPSAVFFGFGHCPEVCPTTLGDIGIWQGLLAEEGMPPLRTFFVTVDPERDTLEMLGDYVSWVPGVIGVSGAPEETEKAIKAFRVYSRKVPLDDGDYTMDHSAMVLLFDDEGRFFEPVRYQEDIERAMSKIRRLLES